MVIWTFNTLCNIFLPAIKPYWAGCINFGKCFSNLFAKTYVNILYNPSIKEIGCNWWNHSSDAIFGTNLIRPQSSRLKHTTRIPTILKHQKWGLFKMLEYCLKTSFVKSSQLGLLPLGKCLKSMLTSSNSWLKGYA